MASITIISLTFNTPPVVPQNVNIKYRLTSAPDIAGSYIDLGFFVVKMDGDFISPVIVSGLNPDTDYTIWGTIECSNSQYLLNLTTPPGDIPCGTSTSFSGGESFPSESIINVGPDLGVCPFDFDALSIPDKYIVMFEGIEVVNTGYRGDTSYQSALDAELASRGLPPETITAPGAGTTSFNKTTAATTATLRVYAPLTGTAWSCTLGCPV